VIFICKILLFQAEKPVENLVGNTLHTVIPSAVFTSPENGFSGEKKGAAPCRTNRADKKRHMAFSHVP
jgi:hypothetical protein